MISINLHGKIALVTASSRGIGKGIARILSISNAKVIIVSRSYEHLAKTSKEISEESGNEVYPISADLRDISSLEKLVREIRDNFNYVDILVFNTGGPKPGYFHSLNMEDWQDAVNLLLYPAVFLTRQFMDWMKRKRWGRIIYSTSVSIKEPIPGLVLSNVVRISMAGLVRTLAKELGEYGITVNGIMPGYIATERIKEIARKRAEESGGSVEDVISNMSKDIPAKRMGLPEEVGYLVAFLASDYASYINGAMIPIDGGLLNSSL